MSSPCFSAFSVKMSTSGFWKKSAAASVLPPPAASVSMRASRATSATPAAEGCTIAHVLLPKIAWNSFSPDFARHSTPPFLRHWNSAERKYQQRGRWQRLPPSVAALRICGVAAPRQASASAGKSPRRPVGHARECDERADGNAAGRFLLNGRMGGQPPEIDDEVGCEVVFLQSIEELGPGPFHLRRNLLLSRRRHLLRGVFPGRRLQSFEGFHALTSRFGTFPRASRIFAGVIGSDVGRMPVACAIAFATAAAVGTVAGSPMPRAWALFLPG